MLSTCLPSLSSEKAPSLLSAPTSSLPSHLPRTQSVAAVLAPGSSWCLGIPTAPREAEPAGAAEGVQDQPESRQKAVLRDSGPGPSLCESP